MMIKIQRKRAGSQIIKAKKEPLEITKIGILIMKMTIIPLDLTMKMMKIPLLRIVQTIEITTINQ